MLDTPSATLPIDAPPGPWRTRHLLDVDQLSTNEIRACLSLAAEMRELRERETRDEGLTGHLVGLAFAEPSTRTRVSFEVAATALGAQVLDLPMAASSATKGESLVDTLHTLERTGIQTLVLRHPASGAPYLAARSTGLRIVNAGDGIHAHPTQALLDALTLEEALGGLNGTVVAIVGDVAHSRVARSDVLLLTRLGASVRLAGPPAWTAGMAGDRVEVHPRLTDALDGADAVMTLRVQLERNAATGVPNLREYTARWGLDEARMRLARPGAPILHPGPTNEGVELTAALAAGSRSLIGTQVRNGVAVRMAVLSLLSR
ncbi:MAG TPA: aspartate carbamoyltransferase catalytic subunit [Candidatus Limnocylindria bacterium]|jgi:aspartate carbamoyltransferase catalytic subunit|nr:aspartate carbamoyltransferase catalytic subunit [Candidatus Limnocylindria bacterium]